MNNWWRFGGQLSAAVCVPVLMACGSSEGTVTFLPVPAETYAVGCTEGDTDCAEEERSTYWVTISRSFYLAETETTDEQYTKCVRTGGCRAAGYPEGWKPWHRRSDLPVVRVSWEDAARFCHWLEGRLPSQTEWEIAARGGRSDWRYPWGNEIPVSEESSARGARFSGVAPAPVKRYAPNGFGLYDMAGNVWEWVADESNGSIEEASLGGDVPAAQEDTDLRMVRGGSSFDPALSLRVSVVARIPQESRLENVGFRCLRESSTP